MTKQNVRKQIMDNAQHRSTGFQSEFHSFCIDKVTKTTKNEILSTDVDRKKTWITDEILELM